MSTADSLRGMAKEVFSKEALDILEACAVEVKDNPELAAELVTFCAKMNKTTENGSNGVLLIALAGAVVKLFEELADEVLNKKLMDDLVTTLKASLLEAGITVKEPTIQ